MGMNIKFLGPDGEDSFELGDTVRVESTIETEAPFSDSRSNIDPDSATITITDYDGNEVVSAANLTKNAVGEYYYLWDTTGESEGDFEVVIDVSATDTNGDTIEEVDEEWVRLN